MTPTYLSHWQPQSDRDLDPLSHTLPSLNPTFFQRDSGVSRNDFSCTALRKHDSSIKTALTKGSFRPYAPVENFMVAKVRIWERLRCADIDRVVMWSRNRCLPKALGFSVSRTMTERSSIKLARNEKDLRFFSQSFCVYRRRRAGG